MIPSERRAAREASGPPASRGRRAGRRKHDVLAVAARVIAERGADATRFTDVSEASGVPVSSLQYYFGSREDLLVAAFRRASSAELEILGAELEEIQGARARLVRIVQVALEGYVPGGSAGQLWIESWRFAMRDEEMRFDVLADYRSWRGLIADAVRLGQTAGDFDSGCEPGRVALTVLALVDGMGPPLALGDIDMEAATAAVLDTMDALLESPTR